MHDVLRYTLIIAALSATSTSQTTAQESYVHVPTDFDAASSVFVGPDYKMPVSRKYYISIDPTRAPTGLIRIPLTISEALMELNRALPKWYLNALLRSHGDRECFVPVSEGNHTEIDYTTLVEDWYWISWNLDDDKTPLRKEFAHLRLESRFMILQAMRMGFCTFVRTGSPTRALQTMTAYGHI